MELRDAAVVMSPSHLGAARLSKFSFNRSMLRRAFTHGWKATRSLVDVDAAGRGRATYRIDAEGHTFQFVAFTTVLDESQHTDRVVADAWEITAALVEPDSADGELDETFTAELAASVPQQEAGRLDPRVLVLTRGNRSVRFFESLVEALASGRQPDPDQVADAGYIMRSTAFYGNGKFGMRSFGGYPDDHPLAAPYRAQMLAAWLFRELSYDVVERCAEQRGGATAVGFDQQWSRYFGLGNATGLGLVPYAFKHPKVLDAWAGVREASLARVRSINATADDGTGSLDELLDRLRWWIDRAETHFAPMGSDGREPWLSPLELSAIASRIRRALDAVAADERPFDSLARWAEQEGVETCELVVSLLIELDDQTDDETVDRVLLVDESVTVDRAMPIAELRRALDRSYRWIGELGLDDDDADHYWWVISDNTEEPRRVDRNRIDPEHREVPVDVAIRLAALRRALATTSRSTVGELLVDEPDHGAAVRRVVGSVGRYDEPRVNACAESFLPLDLQRYQLAMYGMDNFSPKSTDWLRVTLNQGAPRVADLMESNDMDDDWIWPPRPVGEPNPDVARALAEGRR